MMTETQAIAFLTEDGAGLGTPCSPYGRNSGICAPVAYAAAVIVAGETGNPLDTETLDYVMGLVVNGHRDPGYLIANFGEGYGFSPADYLDNPAEYVEDQTC